MRFRIACLMGTYGRYSLACEALACFLQQTAIDEAMLLVYNQHPVPMTFDHPRVRVVNETPPHQGLRHIRKRMMDLMADESIEFYHWWDDDDLYLPWHLADCLQHMGDGIVWKPARSWFSNWNTSFDLTSNRFEGSWFMRASALRAAPLDTHADYSDHPFMFQQEDAGTVRTTDLGDFASYIYRWEMGTQHLSGYGSGDADKQAADIETWRERSSDVRPDGVLVPADLWPRWAAFLEGIKGTARNHSELQARLSVADALSKLEAGGPNAMPVP